MGDEPQFVASDALKPAPGGTIESAIESTLLCAR
jgi:hypothetical protein